MKGADRRYTCMAPPVLPSDITPSQSTEERLGRWLVRLRDRSVQPLFLMLGAMLLERALGWGYLRSAPLAVVALLLIVVGFSYGFSDKGPADAALARDTVRLAASRPDGFSMLELLALLGESDLTELDRRLRKLEADGHICSDVDPEGCVTWRLGGTLSSSTPRTSLTASA